MIDHVYISVTDIDRSLAFYSEALKALGWSAFGNYDSASGPRASLIFMASVTTCTAAGRRSAQASGYVNASSARPGST